MSFTHRLFTALDLPILRFALHIKDCWHGIILQHRSLSVLKTLSSQEVYYTAHIKMH